MAFFPDIPTRARGVIHAFDAGQPRRQRRRLAGVPSPSAMQRGRVQPRAGAIHHPNMLCTAPTTRLISPREKFASPRAVVASVGAERLCSTVSNTFAQFARHRRGPRGAEGGAQRTPPDLGHLGRFELSQRCAFRWRAPQVVRGVRPVAPAGNPSNEKRSWADPPMLNAAAIAEGPGTATRTHALLRHAPHQFKAGIRQQRLARVTRPAQYARPPPPNNCDAFGLVVFVQRHQRP